MKGFSGFKESPVKQKPGGSVGEALEHHKKFKAKKSMPKDFNTKGSKGSTTPGYSTTKAAKKYPGQELSDKLMKAVKKTSPKISKKPASTLSRVTKVFKNTAKQYAKQASKFLGPKTLGTLGMLQATSSKADQPTFPKGSKHYQDPKKKIDFTKKK